MRSAQRLFCLLVVIGVGSGPHAIADAPAQTTASQGSAQTKAKTEVKRIVLTMRDEPWKKVLEWLTEQTQLPLVTSYKPPAGTFTFIPPKGSKGFTIPEIIDILNDGLAASKFRIIRRAASLTLYPTDELPPGSRPHRVSDPQELRSFGRSEMVSIIVRLETLDVERLAPEVRKLLGPWGDVITLADSNRLLLSDTAGNLQGVVELIKELDAESKTYSHPCVYIRAALALESLQNLDAATPKTGRALQLSVDETTNAIIIKGPADRVNNAKGILAKIDASPYNPTRRFISGVPYMTSYPVPAGQAVDFARCLGKFFADQKTVRISTLGPNAVMVYADPESHASIAMCIRGASPPSVTERVHTYAELIPLNTLEAARVVEELRPAFEKPPFIDADTVRNAIIVRGSKDETDRIRALLRALGEKLEAHETGNMRVITLEQGGGAAVAEAVQSLFLPKSVRIVVLGEGQKPPKDDGKGKKDIATVTVAGNKLIVTSDDPQVLATIQEMVRLLTARTGEGEFNIFRLRFAKATDAARIIDEAFNGPPGAGLGKGPGGKDRGRPERVRVVADPAINSLLIKATPLDLLTIRAVLEKLDIDHGPDPGPRTSVLGPFKHAKAEDLAKIIREVYRDHRDYALSVDTRTNRLVLRCSAAMRDDIERLVTELDTKDKAKETSKSREIDLKDGGAATLADAIQRALEQMRPNPVRVIKPGEADKKPPKDGGAKKAEGAPELVIAVFADKLVVTCDDPEILLLVEELVRLYTMTTMRPDYQIVRLKCAKANDVAKILDETFNGPFQDSKPRIHRIRVVADPSINALLIKAWPLDMLMIQKLLETLDVDNKESRNQPEADIEVIRLNHANAAEVARLLDEAFNGRAAAPLGDGKCGATAPPESESGGFGEMMRMIMGSGVQTQRQPRVERIQVVAVPALNALLVRATPLDMLTIRKLLEET